MSFDDKTRDSRIPQLLQGFLRHRPIAAHSTDNREWREEACARSFGLELSHGVRETGRRFRESVLSALKTGDIVANGAAAGPQ